MSVARRYDTYPDQDSLARILHKDAPQIVFISAESVSGALLVIGTLETIAPGRQIVAITRTFDPQTVLDLMRAGVRELLSLPLTASGLEQVLERIERVLLKRPAGVQWTEDLFAFLPAKGGVGGSTLALNTSAAFARRPGSKGLLADFNLGAGTLRFMLRLQNAFSVVDAARHADALEGNLWRQMISSVGPLDVIHAGGPNPDFDMQGEHLWHLLDYIRRTYQTVCIDLPGNMQRYSIDILQEAKRILLVATPDPAALNLARQKCQILRGLGLEDRVRLLINPGRTHAPPPMRQIEDIVGLPVEMTFARDAKGIQKATNAGTPVDPGSSLGKQFTEIADHLLPKRAANTAA